MVKKKAPFIPITIIVIGVGIIFGMNARSHPIDPEELQKQKAEEFADKRPKDTSDDLHKALTNTVKPGPKIKSDGTVPMAAEGPDPRGIGTNPMLAPKQVKYHPTPNANSVDGQWYQAK